METDFDEIEKQMNRNKKSPSQSVDINNIKAKVMSWLMRNGNIKKLVISLVILVSFGLVSIINCIINDIFYIRDFSLGIIIGFLTNYIDKKYFKKSINRSIKFIFNQIKKGVLSILNYLEVLRKKKK